MKIKCKPFERTVLRCPHCNEISFVFVNAKPKNPWYKKDHNNLVIGLKDGQYHKASNVDKCQVCEGSILSSKDWNKEVKTATMLEMMSFIENMEDYLTAGKALMGKYEQLRQFCDWMRVPMDEYDQAGQVFVLMYNKIFELYKLVRSKEVGDKISL